MVTKPCPRQLSQAVCIVALLGATSFFGGCDDSGLNTDLGAAVLLTPTEFRFPHLQVGQREVRRVLVENTGAGTLKIAKIQTDFSGEFVLDWYRGDDERSDRIIGVEADGSNAFPDLIKVEPDETITLVLEYAPQDASDDSGAVILPTNAGRLTIPIETAEASAQINVNPSSIDFGRVAANDPRTEVITVTNVGQSALLFDQFVLSGSQDFKPMVRGEDSVANRAVLDDPDGDGVPGLSPDARFEIAVIYQTETEGPDAAEFAIVSNDIGAGQVIVDLVANGASPCINVVPAEIEFAPSLIERGTTHPLTIESCGGQPLEIQAISIKDGSSEAFTIDPESVPPGLLEGEAASLPAVIEGQPSPSRTVTVVFTPPAQEAYGGTVLIRSNDPLHPEVEVPLLGRGVLNACPVPEVARDDFHVLPLDVITLDGSRSNDPDGPDGRPIKYEWTVTARPDGSTAVPVESFFDVTRPAEGGRPDDPATPTAQLFVDLAGQYQIDLVVTDNQDFQAPSETCPEPTATILVEARPNEDIHVQLVWHTPGDDDETNGEGSDVDMHFLHPQARDWMVAPLDCYYANPEPDWGRLGDPSDDPSLDIDDTNGAGPENVNLDNPENTGALGGNYRVGVHYYRAEDYLRGGTWGPSLVTTRIFLAGDLAWENVEPKEMRATDHFWDVGAIIWTPNDRRFVVRDVYTTNVP